MPVYLRVGDGAECHIGDVTFDTPADHVTMQPVREGIAAFLRAAADAYEHADDG
jgi:hypothetical protein